MDPSALRATRGMRYAQDIKQAIVRRDGPGADLSAALHLVHEGQTIAWVSVPHGAMATMGALSTLLSLSSADGATYMADIYGTTSGGGVEDLPDMEARFAAGDPTVREALLVVSGHRSGACTSSAISYQYAGRRVLWMERLPERYITGVVRSAYGAGWDLQQERQAEGLPIVPFPGLAAAAGCQMAVWPILSARAPDAPCGCESGRVAADCCWA